MLAEMWAKRELSEDQFHWSSCVQKTHLFSFVFCLAFLSLGVLPLQVACCLDEPPNTLDCMFPKRSSPANLRSVCLCMHSFFSVVSFLPFHCCFASFLWPRLAVAIHRAHNSWPKYGLCVCSATVYIACTAIHNYHSLQCFRFVGLSCNHVVFHLCCLAYV